MTFLYDNYGNLISRTATPKPGSPLGAITEHAEFPTATCRGSGGPPVLCWRPTLYRDGMSRQTHFRYNPRGQLTIRTDPADTSGVMRTTNITYETAPGSGGSGTLSRRGVVRICGTAAPGTPCGAVSASHIEYDYWGATLLPVAERRIDDSTGTVLTTSYAYDPVGITVTVH